VIERRDDGEETRAEIAPPLQRPREHDFTVDGGIERREGLL
jgi:hypothetical protein